MTTTTWPKLAIILAGNIALVQAAQAQAADGFATPDGIRVTVGTMAVVAPKYEGGSNYELTALPIFKLSAIGGGGWGAMGRFDVKALDDVSFAIVRHNGFEAGPLVGIRFGRSESDSSRLTGLGDIDGGLVAGGFVKYTPGPLYLRASARQQLTGDDTGLILRLATGAERRVAPHLLVKAEASLDIADDTYMQSFFGVTALQSARSGLRTFDAGAGAKSASATVWTEYALDADWTLYASAGYTRLLGDAADSPIVESADRFDAKLGLSRAFDLKLR